MLYLLAAKYIFGGGNQLPTMVSKLSGTTKNLTAGLMSDPQKMENLISMVRTVTPLTSPQTVTKVNTYLPLFEKASTLLGMYSFLNRAQTFRPIEPLNAKSPTDIMTSLMKNGNMPMGKMLAQPLIANNMEKMMGAMAMNMVKNGGLNDLMKNGGLNDLMKNGGLNEMLSAFTNSSNNNPQEGGNLDLSSLMETFMPIISNMSSNNQRDDYETEETPPKKMEFKNESFLPDDEETESEIEVKSTDKFTHDNSNEKYENTRNDRYDKNYKNEKNNYEKAVNFNEHKNNDIQKPIRIKQRKRRY